MHTNDAIYSEEEMLEALASYKQVREALKNQRNGRGYYGRDSFKGKGFGERPWQRGKGKGKQRVHVEQLKLRTRCWRCGALGHLSRECTNQNPDKPKSSSTSTAPSQISGSSSRAGLFVVQGNAMSAVQSVQKIFILKVVKSTLHVEGRHQSASQCLINRPSDSSEYKVDAADSFCGIVTKSEVGVVDTAGGLVGTKALQRLEHRLQDHGLKIKWVPRQSLAKGIGGQAQVVGTAMVPLGIAGLNGLLEATVV